MMADMRTNLTDILGSPAGRSGAVDEETWSAIAQCLAEGLETLLDLWGSAGGVHMALLEPGSAPFVVNLACSEGRFPSVGASHPPAIRLERAIRDLFGYEADGLKDTRPWLDHGRWGVRHPLGECVVPSQVMPPYTFLPAKAKVCTRSPWGRSMRESSSRVISVSARMARPWRAWKSGWAMSIRASRD